MNKIILFSIAMLGATLAVNGQVTLTGEFRPKFELRDGYKTLLNSEQSPAFVTAQRSRLNLSYSDKRIATFLSVQDVRIWGESPAKADASTINVFQAWAEVYLNDAWSVRLGRQELSYDQNRLLGAANWNDVGASHDLMQFFYHKAFDLQAGFAYNNDKSKNVESNYPVNNYKTLAFVRGEKDLGSSFNASVIILTDGNQKDDSDHTIYQRFTYGGNLKFSNDSVKTSAYASAYLQNGKSPEGIDISAYFLSLNLGYSFTNKLKGLLAAEYFSGDDAFSTSNTKHSFNNLYGNGHNLYGYMDYFQQIDKDTKGGGLMDLYARFNYKFSKKTSAELTYHNFSFTNSVIDSVSTPGISKKADAYLGSEIDFTLKYKPVANFEFSCGYSTMLAAPTMEILKGGSHSRYQQWAWVMLTFKPEFINTKKTNN
jgi:hypothetical protein